jgi:hypothetical protein
MSTNNDKILLSLHCHQIQAITNVFENIKVMSVYYEGQIGHFWTLCAYSISIATPLPKRQRLEIALRSRWSYPALFFQKARKHSQSNNGHLVYTVLFDGGESGGNIPCATLQMPSFSFVRQVRFGHSNDREASVDRHPMSLPEPSSSYCTKDYHCVSELCNASPTLPSPWNHNRAMNRFYCRCEPDWKKWNQLYCEENQHISGSGKLSSMSRRQYHGHKHCHCVFA